MKITFDTSNDWLKKTIAKAEDGTIDFIDIHMAVVANKLSQNNFINILNKYCNGLENTTRSEAYECGHRFGKTAGYLEGYNHGRHDAIDQLKNGKY